MEFQSQTLDLHDYYQTTCSTPYVSAPSSPGRSHRPGPGPGFINSGFYYSAPASPMHFALTQSLGSSIKPSSSTQPSSPDFEFSARFGSGQPGSMTSADELFLNGKIRPMKLSTHLERPQLLAPLMDLEHEDDEDNEARGRDLRGNDIKSSSLRRRTRSMSPLRHVALNNINMCLDKDSDNKPSMSESSSRCSSSGRSSKKWVFLKDFLRSKSEGTGRSNNYKLWSTISFSQSAKAKKTSVVGTSVKGNNNNSKPMNGIGKGKKRVPPSAHELLYTANRAQAEEMRKKTFLPYRQGLLGCLGFSSKSYSAMNGLARALNPVSSS